MNAECGFYLFSHFIRCHELKAITESWLLLPPPTPPQNHIQIFQCFFNAPFLLMANEVSKYRRSFEKILVKQQIGK